MTANPVGVLRVREATAAHRALAYGLIREALFQAPREGHEEATVAHCLQEGIVGMVLDNSGDVAATVGMAVGFLDHTDEPHLRVHWLGVREDRRRSDLAKDLISFVAWCAEQMGDASMPVLIPALASNELLPKMQLYQRRVPQVQALFAFGCPPDYPLLAERRAGGLRGRLGPTGGPWQDGRGRQSRSIPGTFRAA